MSRDQAKATATATATATETAGLASSSTIKAYAIPLTLISISVVYQLLVLPRSFPPTHYDILGITPKSSVDEVQEAYEKLSSKWNSGVEVPSTIEFIKIQYAYELLTNPVWKRDYDTFGIDEYQHVIDKLKEQYAGESFLQISLPLLDNSPAFDDGGNAVDDITAEDFMAMLDNSKPSLIQVYSRGSKRCAEFGNLWKRIAFLLDGVANTGSLEIGEGRLVMSLAERKPTGQFFFRNGVPSITAFPSECKAADCLMRFGGDLSVDAVTDWFATTILKLPRILYQSKETLVPNFLAKTASHKVKVIFFSKTGERATPFVRQTAKNYWAYASFAFVLWREEDFSFWWNLWELESTPAIVFMKDPGVKPVVFHGSVNDSQLLDLMENNKQQELPQLRSATSMELGCDARGYSRAGNDTTSWYCVILAGRLGPELNKMRETMRRIQELLAKDGELSEADKDQFLLPATALRNKRLTFAWLNGEIQEKYCLFYLHSETSYDTCGQRRDMVDVPKLFIVRYKRNATQEEVKVKRVPNNIFSMLESENVDPASQLVARYNGSDEIQQIVTWISETIRDGDTRDLPFFRSKTPDLVPEGSEPIWSKGAQNILSKSMGIKQRLATTLSRSHDYFGDPRIGPMLLLGALMSFGTIWLRRSQSTRSNRSTEPNQSSTVEETRRKRREKARRSSNKGGDTSLADMEPKDSYQIPLSDSESE